MAKCNVVHSRKKEFLKTILFIIFVLLIRVTVLGNYEVPTGSMKPTIIEGDHFFSNNVAYSIKVPFTKIDIVRWGIPDRGEIIAFRYPLDESDLYTKRVIGIPGDCIRITDRQVYLNGKKLETQLESSTNNAMLFEEKLGDVTYHTQYSFHQSFNRGNGEYIVPPGHLFVMGDNRDNSADSRTWGFVPIENVVGKLIFRWFSIDPESLIPRLYRIGTIH